MARHSHATLAIFFDAGLDPLFLALGPCGGVSLISKMAYSTRRYITCSRVLLKKLRARLAKKKGVQAALQARDFCCALQRCLDPCTKLISGDPAAPSEALH